MLRAVPSNLWKIQEALALRVARKLQGKCFGNSMCKGPEERAWGPRRAMAGEGEMSGPGSPGPGPPGAAAGQPNRLKTRLMEVRTGGSAFTCGGGGVAAPRTGAWTVGMNRSGRTRRQDVWIGLMEGRRGHSPGLVTEWLATGATAGSRDSGSGTQELPLCIVWERQQW